MEGTIDKLQGLISEPDFSGIGYNELIIVFIIFVVVLVGFSLGRSRMLLALISLYIAAFIDSKFLYFQQLQNSVGKSGFEIQGFVLHIVLFLIIYAVVLLILHQSFLKDKLEFEEASIIAIFAMSALSIGFLASVLVGYIPYESVLPIPSSTVRVFGSAKAQFVWAILPILCVAFLKEK